MRTTLALFAAVAALLFSNPSAAQQAARTVTISDGTRDNKFQRGVVAALKARIGGTSRYVIAPDNEVAEVEVSVVCIDLSEENTTVNGGTCSFSYTYWPKKMWGLTVELGTVHILTNHDASSAGETLFEELVEASSEAKLTAALTRMQAQVQLYVMMNPPSKTTLATPATPKPTKP
jgi:hypothetical protein